MKKIKFQKRDIIRYSIIIVLLALLGAALYWANYDKPGYYRDSDSGMEYETARVLEVLEDSTTVDEENEGVRQGSMVLTVELLTGRYKGDVIETTNYFSTYYNVYVTEGDTVIVRVDQTESDYSVSVYNHNRTALLIGFCVLFLLALTVIGGKQGVKAVLGLLFTLVCVFFLLVPLVLKGFPAIPTTVGIIAVTTIISFLLLGGLQPKIIAAVSATIIGVVFAAILASVVGYLTNITGYQMEEAESLVLIASSSSLKISGLFICSVLIASVGAVMDIAMSISSAVEELHANNPSMSVKALFASGMNIGRDAMGTMANTLILAFAGSSFNMVIMVYSYGVTFKQLINTDWVAIELIRSIAGSLGIVATVPAAALLASWIVWKMEKQPAKAAKKNKK